MARLPASDWSVMGIYPRFLRLIGPYYALTCTWCLHSASFASMAAPCSASSLARASAACGNATK
eukprot:8844435-Pyramimonas_sp.AAC.1